MISLRNMEKIKKKVLKILFNIFKILKMPDNEYVWYCVRDRCNAIIMKTRKPFLADDGIIVCRRCNESVTFQQLMEANKHNVKKFLKRKDKTT